MNDAQGDIQEAIAQLGLIVKGQGPKLRWLLAAYLCGRHVLLEDRPGTGKTTLAKGLGLTLGLKTDRVQFTPDLLPSPPCVFVLRACAYACCDNLARVLEKTQLSHLLP